MPEEPPNRNPGEAPKRSAVSGETVLGYAVLGCLISGTVGLIRAITAETSGGAASCLIASVAAFATVCFVYLRK